MTGDFTKPFDRSYWVVPGKLLAGCYPGDKNREIAKKKLQGLIDCGIRLVVNLMEESELDHGTTFYFTLRKT